VPGCVGAATCAVRFTLWPDARSAGSFVRDPSQTTAAPAPSYQWYPRFTGNDEVTGNVPCPAFVTVTGTLAICPAVNAGALRIEPTGTS